MGAGHPECPERLDAIDDWLLATGVADALDRREAPAAPLSALARAHTAHHLQALQAIDRRLAESGAGLVEIDPDTAANPHTWQAALHAAGATIAATDAVIAGTLENAFCAVRPPGHHACRDRAMGFCIFNNVAIAARHALEHHGLQRVAIVDFDVHHGNGTEDIVSNDPRILMVSFFQHPHYPYSGADGHADNILNVPVPAYTKGDAVRVLVQSLWLPRLHAFAPEMIFISAGFDAHRDDDLGQMGLVEADYAWITQQLKEVARTHAKGRIVSSLEGGYNLRALGLSVEAHLRVLADLSTASVT
jgi:acetoin utilization deacetylase AcuC-like enzyme